MNTNRIDQHSKISANNNKGSEMEFSAATQASRYDRSSMRAAMHVLEDSLASSSPNRERRWMKRVSSAAADLEQKMRAQAEEFNAPAGLLEDIVRDAPRLAHRVDRLRQLHLAALTKLSELARLADSAAAPDDIDIAEIRQKLGEVLVTIRNLQATESDLIYEAYSLDIGVGD